MPTLGNFLDELLVRGVPRHTAEIILNIIMASPGSLEGSTYITVQGVFPFKGVGYMDPDDYSLLEIPDICLDGLLQTGVDSISTSNGMMVVYHNRSYRVSRRHDGEFGDIYHISIADAKKQD